MQIPVLFLKSHVNDFTRKDGSVVKAHETKVQAAVPRRPGGPGEGEIGDHEHQQYGAYFKKGAKVKDRAGATHNVLNHQGADVLTDKGEHFHPTKLTPVADTPAKPAAKKKAAPALDPHPNVIGKAANSTVHSFDFGGKSYHSTGKEGHSFHDGTPVTEHESEDGHRVWKDEQGRVHADSREEAKKARGGK